MPLRSHAPVLVLALVLACTADPPGDDPDTTGTTATTSSDGPGTSDASGSSSTAIDGSEASSSTSATDDGASSEGETSTGTPVELIPVFVALGDGGWTASSCDRGQSWTTQALSDEKGDHTPWTAFGGLAHRDGAFVAGLGWGAPGHILRSTDGRTWEDLPASSFTEDGMEIGYGSHTGGVAATDDALMIFGQRVWRSTDGASWQSVDVTLPPGAEQLRQLRGFAEAGLLVAAVESQSGNQHPQGNFVVVSDDGGVSWTEGTGFVSGCADPIQHWGDIEMLGDTLVVGTQDLCVSPDRGLTWELVAAPTGEAIQDLYRDDAAFVAISSGRTFRSTDGLAWTELGEAGMPLRAGAWADGVHAAVAPNGTALLWSDDGVTWTPGTIDRPPASEIWIRDFIGVAVEGTCEG